MMSIEYSQNATSRIEDYFQKVRNSLMISRGVDAQEVIDGLREHIERELSGKPQPISEADAADVIRRLGSPEQFVDESEMAWWRKFSYRMQKGPEDWRLAYLSFGVLILGGLLTGPFGLIASFLLARASLAVSGRAECEAKRWLLYPSLILMYVMMLGLGLLWPIALGDIVGEMNNYRDGVFYQPPYFDHDGVGTILSSFAAGGLGLAVWWTILWFLWRKYSNRVRVIFRPFAETWTGATFGKIILLVWFLAITLGSVAAWLWFKT